MAVQACGDSRSVRWWKLAAEEVCDGRRRRASTVSSDVIVDVLESMDESMNGSINV